MGRPGPMGHMGPMSGHMGGHMGMGPGHMGGHGMLPGMGGPPRPNIPFGHMPMGFRGPPGSRGGFRGPPPRRF
jgi:hypothetical protein